MMCNSDRIQNISTICPIHLLIRNKRIIKNIDSTVKVLERAEEVGPGNKDPESQA